MTDHDTKAERWIARRRRAEAAVIDLHQTTFTDWNSDRGPYPGAGGDA